MHLQTIVPLKQSSKELIKYSSKIILLGSCFSENIGNKLTYYKFQTTQNPLGILFHPKAIEKLIVKSLQEEKFTESELIYQNEQWHCFDAHSSLSNSDKTLLLNSLNQNLEKTKAALLESNFIIITLGTAWVYRHLASKNIVANCHKIPQKEFSKELLSISEIQESLTSIYSQIKAINKKVTVIFTASPVRHLKDGFVENTQSKSHLISAIHQTIKNTEDTFYFPSYEIMMDELRDYRFYNDDMVHPNKLAIEYIWEKFSSNWIANSEKHLMKEIETIQKGIAHKPFNEKSKQHQLFLEKLDKKKENINKRLPHILF